MKNFNIKVKIEWENSVQAESKLEAIKNVKDIFLHEHNMSLFDSEIISVEEDTFPPCPYCGSRSDSTDPRILCKDCREDFGHVFIDEL